MAQRRIVVYGGKGALGSVCVEFFRKQNWWVNSIDLHENDQANENIIINTKQELIEQETNVIENLSRLLGDEKLDAIICVAGGWAGGSAKQKDFIKNSELMIQQSIWSSLIATKLATKFLKNNGLLTLTGAKAALEPTPTMIGYGMAKSAVHHLVKSLSQEKSGLPSDSSILAILPVTLDTPMNRKFMPNADFNQWTSLTFVAELFSQWIQMQPNERPKSGSLVQLLTENGQTTLKID